VYFAVWAPDAVRVSVIGEFNGWDRSRDALVPRARSGIWEGFVAGAKAGQRYKYHVVPRAGPAADKADPLAFQAELPPDTAAQAEPVAWHGYPQSIRLTLPPLAICFSGAEG
jgi:1,4-alpha-glucan branching enzyme